MNYFSKQEKLLWLSDNTLIKLQGKTEHRILKDAYNLKDACKEFYEYVDEQKTIDEALKNLLHVCPNCHRVIHKQHITTELLSDFKNSITKNTIIL